MRLSDSAGLITSMKAFKVDITTSDGVCDCYVAYPEEEGTHPGVLFYMDGYGPREYLYEMAQKLASHGYYVLLPNLLYRIRKAPVVDANFPLTEAEIPKVRKQLMSLLKSFDPEDAVKDARVFLDFLSTQKQVLPDRIGVTGYCMGGGMAVRTAAEYPERIRVAASFHGGRLATDAPNSPHLLLDKIKARLYFAHADQDASMPLEGIERLNKALDQSNLDYEAEIYAGALHGFTMADLPAYNKEALERHWKKLFQLFDDELKL